MRITLLVGLPLSGKTYYIEREENVKESISLSKILKLVNMTKEEYKGSIENQELVREKERELLRELMAKGEDFFIDYLNLTYESRGKWIRNIKEVSKAVRIDAIYIHTSFDRIKKRNKRSGTIDIDILKTMNKRLIPPNIFEGFKRVGYEVPPPWELEREERRDT